MYTTTDLLNQYFDKINESSSTAGKERALRGFNQKQKMICNIKDFWWSKKPFYIETVEGQQAYDLNPLIRKPETVGMIVDEITYPVTEIALQEDWNRYNGLTGTGVTSDVPTYYHIANGKIYLFPTPSVSGNDIEIWAYARPRLMSMENYTTGTISVTSGSKTVEGASSPAWLSATNFRAGAFIFIGPEKVPYEVASITDNDTLVLVKPYFGTTASGLSYIAGDTPLIHEDYADVLWAMEALEYLGIKKGNTKMYAQLKDFIYNDETGIYKLMINTTLSESAANVVQKRRVSYAFNPNEYPQDLTA
ncbi:MAG: hypothetical protein ACP5NS_05050 [Candidatus Pacearchaeota archaeon]